MMIIQNQNFQFLSEENLQKQSFQGYVAGRYICDGGVISSNCKRSLASPEFQGINCLSAGKPKKYHGVSGKSYLFLPFFSIALAAKGHLKMKFENGVM